MPKKSIFSHNLEHTFFFLKSGLLEKNNSVLCTRYYSSYISYFILFSRQFEEGSMFIAIQQMSKLKTGHVTCLKPPS